MQIFDVTVETIRQGADQTPKSMLVLSLTSPNGRAWPKTLVLIKTNQLVLSGAFAIAEMITGGTESSTWKAPSSKGMPACAYCVPEPTGLVTEVTPKGKGLEKVTTIRDRDPVAKAISFALCGLGSIPSASA